eukprot:TRINITY_DN25899_c0_g1_i1.p1 TRINITY_DN25899_c0_g1~~TRINITY_DN25899_c0_g1_i1.p1  ORF type:complete len:595 (-),score=90.19 TRINITY_DN25899_c0_g1_i1:855-2639(-)
MMRTQLELRCRRSMGLWRRTSVRRRLCFRSSERALSSLALAAEEDCVPVASAPWSQAVAALRARLRKEPLIHDSLMSQLRVAASLGRLDPVEWKKVRSELVDAAGQMRPSELVCALQALAALRSVEVSYLQPVLKPFEHMAYYMSGAQLASSMISLASMLGSKDASVAAASISQRAAELASLVEYRLQTVPADDLISLLGCLCKLGCLHPKLFLAVLNAMPNASTLSPDRILSLLLAFVDGMAVVSAPSTSESEAGDLADMVLLLSRVEGSVAELRFAIRLHLSDHRMTSRADCARLLVASLSVEKQVVAVAARCRQDVDSNTFSEELVESHSFHQMLVAELAAAPFEAFTDLEAAACAQAAQAVGEVHRSHGASSAPSAALDLVVPLSERILQLLEVFRTEDLLAALEALTFDLEYVDGYFCDRVSEALRPRLVPVYSETKASLLGRSLHALAWQHPVAFAGLFGSVLEDLSTRAKATPATVALHEPALREVVAMLPAGRDSSAGSHDIETEEPYTWLAEVQGHFRRALIHSCERGLDDKDASGRVKFARWALDASTINTMRERWLFILAWQRGGAIEASDSRASLPLLEEAK